MRAISWRECGLEPSRFMAVSPSTFFSLCPIPLTSIFISSSCRLVAPLAVSSFTVNYPRLTVYTVDVNKSYRGLKNRQCIQIVMYRTVQNNTLSLNTEQWIDNIAQHTPSVSWLVSSSLWHFQGHEFELGGLVCCLTREGCSRLLSVELSLKVLCCVLLSNIF